MIEMTPAARERFDNYLQRIHGQLRGRRSEVADEVEQSVREHIEIALADAHAPVGATQVIGVLERLGPPERWLVDDEPPAARPFRGRVLEATDHWLAYLSFGLFVASATFFMYFGFFLVIPAMVLSRAYLEHVRERGEPLGAHRWLVYPAIAVVLAFAAVLLILAPPLALIAALRLEDLRLSEVFNASEQTRFAFGMSAIVFGSWWIIAAGFCSAFLRPIRTVFAPLLDGLRRKHFAVLAGIGALVAAGGGTLIYLR